MSDMFGDGPIGGAKLPLPITILATLGKILALSTLLLYEVGIVLYLATHFTAMVNLELRALSALNSLIVGP
jgi:hypothetical protein